ncbi:putative oxidoreductase [Escherichia coli]|nr:putative oxidoreductase [Escherichia coli]
MHRRAGSQRETVQAVTDGALIDITDMREWREERGQGVVHKPIPGWQSTLEQRGFVGCARHFIECVQKPDSSANRRRTGRAGATYR